jgi:hypothetical protein
MTFLNGGTRMLTPDCSDPFSLPVKKATRSDIGAGRLRAGLEGFLVIALFMVLSAAALFLRARLGLAH